MRAWFTASLMLVLAGAWLFARAIAEPEPPSADAPSESARTAVSVQRPAARSKPAPLPLALSAVRTQAAASPPRLTVEQAHATIEAEHPTREQATAALATFVGCLRETPDDLRCQSGLALTHRQLLPLGLPSRRIITATAQ